MFPSLRIPPLNSEARDSLGLLKQPCSVACLWAVGVVWVRWVEPCGFLSLSEELP